MLSIDLIIDAINENPNEINGLQSWAYIRIDIRS